MKPTIVLIVAVLSGVQLSTASEPLVHKFELWGKWATVTKLNLYLGFTNGLVTAAMAAGVSASTERKTPGLKLLGCLVNDSIRPSYDQAIAMIDKYYRNHPEKWNTLLGEAIIEALLVNDGPCPA